MSAPPEVVVVGGGITALAAAYQLTGGASPARDAPHVTVVEAADRVGGKLGVTEIAGYAVDSGPDGVLAHRPETRALVEELGHGDRMVPVAASGASVLARGKLRSLPDALYVGVPTSWTALRRSGVLSPPGLARALVDVVAPRGAPAFDDDASLGDLVAAKLGDEVVGTLVDPLLGGIHAGRARSLSTAALLPELLDVARERGGLMKNLRARAAARGGGGDRPGPPPALFLSLTGGMHSLPGLLADELRRRGVTITTGRPVTALERDADGHAWRVATDDGARPADGVVVCTPARATADLIRPHAPGAAAVLENLTYASVGVVTFAFAAGGLRVPSVGTGALVPAGTVHRDGPRRGERWLTTALTYLDRKWPHLARPGQVRVRMSVGRIDDDRLARLSDAEVCRITRAELSELLGPTAEPLDATVTRWVDALAQYEVGHLRRVAAIEGALAPVGGLEVAGAAYHGLGVPACIAAGRSAADRLRLPRRSGQGDIC